MAEPRDKTVRRRTGKWARIPIGFLALVIMCLVVPFILVRFEGPRNWMLDRGPGAWLLDQGTRLRVERVERLDPGNARLRGVVLSVQDSLGQWIPWARISRLSASWDVRDLVFGRYRIHGVEVESLFVDQRDAITPRLKPESPDEGEREASGPAQAQTVSCGRISLGHLELRKNDELVAEGRLGLHDLEWAGGRLETDLDTLWLRVHEASGLPGGENLWMALSRGALWLNPDGSMSVQDLVVEAPGVRGGGWALRSARDEESRWHVSLRPRTLRPADIVAALGWSLPVEIQPVAEDTLSGFVSLVVHPDTIEARAELTGRWAGRPLDLKGMAHRTAAGWRAEEIRLRRPDGELVLAAWANPDFTRANGALSVRNLNLEGSDIPWDAAPLGATNLTGRVNLSLERPQDGPWSLDYVIGLDRSRVRSWTLEGLRAGGRIDSTRVQVDSLWTEISVGSVSGSGSYDISEQRLDAAFDLNEIPSLALTERFISPPLVGHVSGHVRLVGGQEAFRLRGSAHGRDLIFGEISAAQIDCPEFDLFLPEITGDGQLQAQEMRIGPLRTKQADVRFKGSAKGLWVVGVARLEDHNVAWTGLLTPSMPGGLDVSSFKFQPPEGPAWSSDGHFHIGWSSGGVSLTDLALSSPSGWIESSGTLAQEGTVDARLEGEVEIHSALDGWNLVPDSTRGIVRLDVRASGPLRDPRLDVEFGGDSLLLLNWPLEDVYGKALWEDGRLRLEEVDAQGPWGRADVARFDVAPLDSLGNVLSRLSPVDYGWLEGVPVAATFRLRDVDLDWLARKMSIELVEPPALTYRTASAGNLESIIRVVRPEESVPGLRYADRPEGLWDVDVELMGTPGHPALDISARAHDIGYRWSHADTLAARLAYDAGTLTIERVWWATGERGGEISGTFPLSLSLAPPSLRVSEDEGMDLNLRIPRANLAILDPLSELLQEPRGVFHADLQVRGPVKEPVLLGSVQIEDGSLRIPLREERLRQIQGRLRMDSLGVHIEKLEARLGRDGKVNVEGRFRTEDDMDMAIKVRKGTFFETGVYQVVGDGDMRIVAQRDSVTGEIRPHALGTATVREALLLNLQPRESPGPPRPDPWIVVVQVSAPSNITWNEPNARVQLGNGSFLVTRRDQWWNAAGSIEVQSGWYRLFNNQFDIRQGTVDFRDSGKGLDVVSDVTAETRITGVMSAEGEPVESVTITAHVQGSPEEMEVNWTSDPPMGEEEIIELLSLGRLTARTEGNGGATEETRAFLVSEFIGRLEQTLAQQSPILRRVDVRQDEEGAYLVIQPVVSSQFSVNYAQQLSLSPTQEVTLHYRLSDVLFLKAGMLHERIQDGTENEEYNLDLKLRIEYGGGKREDKQDR